MDTRSTIARCTAVTLARCAFTVVAAVSAIAASGQTLDEASLSALTAESLQESLKLAETSMQLDADTKLKVADRYRSTLRELTKINDAKANAERFQQDARTAAEHAAALRAELEREIQAPQVDVLQDKSLEELDAERLSRDAELNILKQKLKEIEAQRQQRTDRRTEIRRMQAEAESKRAELRQQANLPAQAGEPVALAEARRLDASMRLIAFERALSAAEFELAKYSAEESASLLTHTENLTRERLAREEAIVKRLSDEVNTRRRLDAEQQIRQAEQQKMLAHPLLKPLAEQNRLDAEESRKFSTKIEGIDRDAKQTRERLERQQSKFADVRMKEADIGLTRPIGLLLREQRSQFPNLREMERQLDARQELLDQARLSSWEYADDLKNLADARAIVREASAEAKLSYEQCVELERMAAELLASRRSLLTELKRSSERYFEALLELDTVDRRYLQSCEEYLHYINERILWIRSTDPLSLKIVAADTESRTWLLSTASWWTVLGVLATDPLEHPFAFWPTVLAVLSLFYVRLSIRPRLRALGVSASKRGFLRYGPTGQAAALTLMSAITAPAALLLFSWRLAEGVDPTNFVQSVGSALAVCAAVLFPVELLRESCRHMGLAEAHFAWPARAVGHLRRVLTWMKTVGMPVTFLAVLAHDFLPLAGGTSTERVLFIGGMLLAATTLHRLLSGNSEFSKAFLVESPGSLFIRLRHLWYSCAVAVPLALAVLSAVGFHYSAIQVAERLSWTLWLVAGIVLARALAVRWVVLSRRRLVLDQAYQRRAAAAEEASQDTTGTPKPPAVEETDVTKSTMQTRKLVDIVVLGFSAIGLAMIWAETLPAIGLLDRPLWQIAEGSDHAAAATPSSGVVGALPIAGVPTSVKTFAAEDPMPGPASVTTLDLGLAIALAIFTFLASRNLPGLMEMSVLNRLPVDNATRYAATRLACYTIVIVGVLMATNRLGLRWQNVQWLAAALTVGLGFGLQEVFANFVSGLIILFERPIRVGDIVTIDDVTGSVSRIRMRATTITNWDRKEFIVPNKEFITGRVLNWTLSDAVNRITINVGVAYGTDTEKAREILLRICDEHPLLLKDPAPMAVFEGFGDSKLNFVLRCFLPSLEGRLDAIHSLNTTIAAEFKKADIEIAFPQQDLRIRLIDQSILPMTLASRGNSSLTLDRAAG